MVVGETGELIIKDLQTTNTNQENNNNGLKYQHNIGNKINNSVWIYSQSQAKDRSMNDLRLLISSNDKTVKLFSLGNQIQNISNIKFSTPINYSAGLYYN